jgi:hypothetical protein
MGLDMYLIAERFFIDRHSEGKHQAERGLPAWLLAQAPEPARIHSADVCRWRG